MNEPVQTSPARAIDALNGIQDVDSPLSWALAPTDTSRRGRRYLTPSARERFRYNGLVKG
jgi:hypothetical protein